MRREADRYGLFIDCYFVYRCAPPSQYIYRAKRPSPFALPDDGRGLRAQGGHRRARGTVHRIEDALNGAPQTLLRVYKPYCKKNCSCYEKGSYPLRRH